MDPSSLSRLSLLRAIEADEQGRGREAVRHYSDAVEWALLALGGRGETERARDLDRIRGWLSRAEKLKREMSENKLASEGGVGVVREPKFEGVCGMDEATAALKESLVIPRLHPNLFQGERKPWKSILLFGPPGTGKSHLSDAIAKETGCPLISISASDVVAKWQGESEKAIRELFERARRISRESSINSSNAGAVRCVIFFDEIDSIGRRRDAGGESGGDTSRRVLTELLKQMDGVESGGASRGGEILVVGATNVPEELDGALLRRFEKRIYVGLPALGDRARILAKSLGRCGKYHNLSAANVLDLARLTKNYSGADLAGLANNVLMAPVRRALRAERFAYTNDGGLEPVSEPSTVGMRDLRNTVKLKLLDPAFDSAKLRLPLANWTDACQALADSRPSLDPKSVARFAEVAQVLCNGVGGRRVVVETGEETMRREEKEELMRWLKSELGEERDSRVMTTSSTILNEGGQRAERKAVAA